MIKLETAGLKACSTLAQDTATLELHETQEPSMPRLKTTMKFHLLFLALILSACFSSLSAQDHGWPVAAQVSVPDVQVVTQTGARLRFNSELLKGRVAIVTGFFTTCTSMCPITQESLAHVAKLLGPRLGKDVVIVSLSTDPANDTPARLKAWAEKFHIASGWTLASGNKAEIETLLKSLNLYVEIPQRHQSLLMVGSESSGWVRVSSWMPAEKLVKLINDQNGNAKKNAYKAVVGF